MKIQQFYEMSQAADLVVFREMLEGFAGDFGFEKYTCCMVYESSQGGLEKPEVQFRTIGNAPVNFVNSTNVEQAMRDPLLKSLRRMSTPVIYDRKLYEEAGAGDLWEEQAAFGYKTGIAVAVHMPGDRHFLLGMDRVKDLPRNAERLTRLLANLQLLTVHAQSAGERLLMRTEAASSDRVSITPREREILMWTMEGKSQWAVGEILGISENSVKFHLKNILRKMNSSSKHQAVLRAISLGLIERR